MAFEQILTDVSERVLTITLNRPERLNAWTPTMASELIEAFDRADANDEVRVVIVTGAGRGFCAGADLAAGGETFDYRARMGAEAVPRDNGGQVVLRIFESTKPVIAAINGPAVGVGATMTLPMDIRLAADDARMGFVFVRRGIVPEACSSWFLPRIVGISRALEWATTGRVFPAREGLEGGLLRSLHPAGELLDAAREHRFGDRREHRAGVGRARPAPALDDARRRASDDRPPRGLAGNVLPRSIRRRGRGHHGVLGEAPGPLPRSRQRRAAGHHAGVERPGVRVAQPLADSLVISAMTLSPASICSRRSRNAWMSATPMRR